jgi:hypothetical protein
MSQPVQSTVNTEPLNVSNEIRQWIKALIPSITTSRITKWIRMHYCIGYELATLGILNFVLRPDVKGTYIDVMYETKQRKDSEALSAELKRIHTKLKKCFKDSGIKDFQVQAYKKLPGSGGGGDEPLAVMPR